MGRKPVALMKGMHTNVMPEGALYISAFPMGLVLNY